uniref:Uncharacterized protein n=1 Tax=Plectus sambesii TaxID=2011161 RepID=A0A914WLS5_9BILA
MHQNNGQIPVDGGHHGSGHRQGQHHQQQNKQQRTGRRLLVLRHGERIDFTFNQDQQSWVHKAFDANGKYSRFNINMPRSVPARKDGPAGFLLDTPLTEMGYLQAKITGRALRDAGVKVSHIYCSSALRCVQTTVGILKGMNNCSQLINVEPGLFEWGAWCRPKRPKWMDMDEFQRLGYPINLHYQPVVSPEMITPSEKLGEYYNRSFDVVKRILANHKQVDDGVILLVAHGASLETCTRQLTGQQPRETPEFFSILHRTPYLACAQAVEEAGSSKWAVAESPILPFQHQQNAAYDWRLLITEIQ